MDAMRANSLLGGPSSNRSSHIETALFFRAALDPTIEVMHKPWRQLLTQEKYLGYFSQIMPPRKAQPIIAALTVLLRPLIRILLRHGIPCDVLSMVARQVYVHVAG